MFWVPLTSLFPQTLTLFIVMSQHKQQEFAAHVGKVILFTGQHVRCEFQAVVNTDNQCTKWRYGYKL